MSKRAEQKAWEWSVANKVDPYSMGQAYAIGYEQAEKDLAMSYPMPEDTTIFQKGVAEGRRLEREDFPDNLSWRDIKRIVQIADNMLDDPKMRVAVQNHSEEEYYKSVWKKWRKTVSD